MPNNVTVYYRKKALFVTSTCTAWFRKSTGVQDEKLDGALRSAIQAIRESSSRLLVIERAEQLHGCLRCD